MMRRSRSVAGAGFLAVVLVLSGCGETAGPLAPETGPAPEFATSNGRSLRILRYVGSRASSTSCVSAMVVPASEGTLRLAGTGHSLYVPQGAVPRASIFEMCPAGEGMVGVELTATSVGSSEKNDVGARGFRRPLTLTLSWEGSDYTDPSSLAVALVVEGKVAQVQASTADEGSSAVSALLKHFSGYALVEG